MLARRDGAAATAHAASPVAQVTKELGGSAAERSAEHTILPSKVRSIVRGS